MKAKTGFRYLSLMILLLAGCISLAQNTSLRPFPGTHIHKSRFSSEPQYLCKDEQSYWFFYRDGRDQACILRLSKDLDTFSRVNVDYNPEHDKVKSGQIQNGKLEVDVLSNSRAYYNYIRYSLDTSTLLSTKDTLFRFKKDFPLQAIHLSKGIYENKEIIWFIPEEKGYTEYRRLYLFGSERESNILDSIKFLEDKGHLTEILHSELHYNQLRIYLKQYDIRPSEKRAFSVNYSYGWMDLDWKEANEQLTLIDRGSYFLSNPCFDRLNGDSVFVAGLYGAEAKSRATGFFQFTAQDMSQGNDTSWLMPRFQPFNDSFWQNHLSLQRKRTLIRPKQLHHYFIQSFDADVPSDRCTYVLQQLYTTDGGSIAGSQLYYHYKDFVIFRTNAQGDLSWYSHLPANQVIYEPFVRFAGSSVFNEGESVLIFQNEHRRVAGKSHARRSMNHPSQGELVMRRINSSKSETAEKIRPSYTSGKTALPSSMIKIRQGQYLVFFESTHELVPVYIYL